MLFLEGLAFGNFGCQYCHESQIFDKQLHELPNLQYQGLRGGVKHESIKVFTSQAPITEVKISAFLSSRWLLCQNKI
jgi:hypothetical protein